MTLTELVELTDAVDDIKSLLIPSEGDSKEESLRYAKTTLENVKKIVNRLDSKHKLFGLYDSHSDEMEVNWKEYNLALTIQNFLYEAINTAENE